MEYLEVAIPSSPLSLPRTRSPLELRSLHMSVGLVRRAAGSALVELAGQTKVIAAVYGPRQLPATATAITQHAQVNCSFRYAPFAKYTQAYDIKGKRTEEEIHLSKQLEDAITSAIVVEKYPKSAIEVHVLVLDAVGGEFAAGICAASLALADAGLDMYDLVAASCVEIDEEKICVDPDRVVQSNEPNMEQSCMTIAYMAALQQVTHVTLFGTAMDIDQVNSAVEIGIDAASKTYRIMQNTLLEHLRKP